MFEATARVIVRQGLSKLTTNAIAAECGISIGSVYQYFPNKQALLLAMAERAMNRTATEILTAVAKARSTGSSAAHVAVAALFGSNGPRHQVRRALIEVAAQAGRSDLLLKPLTEIRDMLSTRPHRKTTPVAAFVLASAVLGVLRASLADERINLLDPDLHAEVVRLIISFDRR
jgi:AcrR family transcriptional regulator